MSQSHDVHNSSVHTAWSLLKYTYGLVAIIAGADKFFNYLVDWSMYLNPSFLALTHLSTTHFMYTVGIIEIAVGLLILTYTRLGATIVSAWLALLAIDLVTLKYYDIAVRDAVMAVGAYVLVLLTDELSK
jgi:hypothetical protein